MIATALALLVAACGGSPSSTGGSSNGAGAANSRALAFSHCMRSHGLRDYPDPNSSGGIPKETPQQLGVSPSAFQVAQRACAHLLPSSGGMTQVQKQQALRSYRDFTACMRSHGVGDWPDPTTDSEGRAIFEIQGIDPDSQRISTDIQACRHLLTSASVTGPPHAGWPFMCSETGAEPWSAGPCSRD